MACEPERVVIITPPMPSDLASGLGSVASWAYVWSAASAASKVMSRFIVANIVKVGRRTKVGSVETRFKGNKKDASCAW